MNLPLRSYFFSPLSTKLEDKLLKYDQLFLDVHKVEIQTARLSDISTTFRMALRDKSKSALLLFAESLRSNTAEFPLNYNTDMTVENLSTLYTLSFTKPRLDPSRDGDFCAYFVLESRGSETFVTDLAVFIRTLGQELMKWSVLGDPSRVDPCDPAHPVLRDIAYCWDGVACGYGVLQFSAIPVSVTNIRRNFHQTSRIFEPLCHRHRHEYFSSGIFSDWEDALLPLAFAEIEAAAQELCDEGDLFVIPSECAGRLPY